MRIPRSLFIFSLILCNGIVNAEMQTYIRSYTYQASEIDSKLTARKAALTQVEQLLLSELGTLVKSRIDISQNSQGKNFSQHEITALTGGIVKTEIITEQWNGYQYIVKARLQADPEKIAKRLMKADSLSIKPTTPATIIVSQQKLLLNSPGIIKILARHDTGGYADDDEVTAYLSTMLTETVRHVTPKDTTIINETRFSVTKPFLYEDYETVNSKKMCANEDIDMIVSGILEESDGGYGMARSMIVAIYRCKDGLSMRDAFVPEIKNHGRFPREVSTRKHLRQLINNYTSLL